MKLRPTSQVALQGAKLVIAFAGLGLGGAVWATPQVQACSPIEVNYNGDRSMAYNLPCTAGAWELTYTGTVPAGVGATRAHYRVKISHPTGANFTMDRVLDIPRPAYLGHALLREAVLLDNGDIALSDCAKVGCTTYRPLGAISRLTAMNKPEPIVDGEPTLASEEATSRLTEEGLHYDNNTAEPKKGGSSKTFKSITPTKYIKPAGKITTPQGDVVHGGVESLSSATITVTPLIKRLRADNDALAKEIEELSKQLVDKDLELVNTQQQLDVTRKELDMLKKQLQRSGYTTKGSFEGNNTAAQLESSPVAIPVPVPKAQVEVEVNTQPQEPVKSEPLVQEKPSSKQNSGAIDYKETILPTESGSGIRVREYTENLEQSNPSLKKELDREIEAITAKMR